MENEVRKLWKSDQLNTNGHCTIYLARSGLLRFKNIKAVAYTWNILYGILG